MPFFLLCPQIYSDGFLVTTASVWHCESLVQSQKLNRERGSTRADIRRDEIWPAAPVAKKVVVTEGLGMSSSRGVMLWAARDGPRLTAGSLG